MNKLISTILIAAVLLTLCGCGSEPASTTAAQTASETEQDVPKTVKVGYSTDPSAVFQRSGPEWTWSTPIIIFCSGIPVCALRSWRTVPSTDETAAGRSFSIKISVFSPSEMAKAEV